MIGAWLYQISQSENISQPAIQRRLQRVAQTTAATTVTIALEPIPNDKIFILSHISVHALGGGAQNYTSSRIEVEDEVGNVLAELVRDVRTPVNEIGFKEFFNIILLPKERINIDAFFSAGAIGNFVSITQHGLFMPRGNLQLR